MDNLSGVKIHRSRFNLSHRKLFDADYYQLIPILYQFCVPGDVMTIGSNIFVRSMPMMAPVMNKSEFDVRYFFVPLRLVADNCEEVITGSKNGKVLSQVPSFKKYVENQMAISMYVGKNSFFDYLGCPLGQNLSDFPVSDYVAKSYYRIWFDYYRDENLQGISDDNDFDSSYLQQVRHNAFCGDVIYSCLQKNYFTSSLPWQLKGEIPSFSFTVSGYTDFSKGGIVGHGAVSQGGFSNEFGTINLVDNGSRMIDNSKLNVTNVYDETKNNELLQALNANEIVAHGDQTFTASDLRSLFAETRIMERLARCGSRYVEYLTSNFGVAPRDDTLQRAQYLGGYRQPIVFTEIPQTGQDAENPVGTLRGKGISSGGDMPVKKFFVKEFGVIFGIMNIRADLLYSQGIDRTMCYSERWDFFNPSLQNLSEQTIKNYEIFYSNDGKNEEPFGFTPMYQELRKSKNIVCGDMRDTLSYWTQPIKYETRPNLNNAFIYGKNYKTILHSPFVDLKNTLPFIVDCQNIVEAIRPISQYSIPGLIDHN